MKARYIFVHKYLETPIHMNGWYKSLLNCFFFFSIQYQRWLPYFTFNRFSLEHEEYLMCYYPLISSANFIHRKRSLLLDIVEIKDVTQYFPNMKNALVLRIIDLQLYDLSP